MTTTAAKIAVHLDPERVRWRQRALDHFAGLSETRLFGRSRAEWRSLTCAELASPADRPIIATGHQAHIWHPGILAKFIAADATASEIDGVFVHLVVDQDDNHIGSIDIPVRRDGVLQATSVDLVAAPPDVPTSTIEAQAPEPVGSAARSSAEEWQVEVARGLREIRAALGRHVDANSLASQFASALDELMSSWIVPAHTVLSTSLLRTSFGRQLVHHIQETARDCAEAYNSAVAEATGAGLAPLDISSSSVELPLWLIGADGSRRRASLAGLKARDDSTELAPRALMMTALMRLVVCDLFVHGTGGIAYDRATELWIRDWLGAELAPICLATADLTLPFDDEPADSIPTPHVALQLFRHAWHDPPAAGSAHQPSAGKLRHLQRIAKMPRSSSERLDAFREMHEWIARERESHREKIDRRQRELEVSRSRAREAPVRARRSWPFPLYPKRMIDELAELVQQG